MKSDTLLDYALLQLSPKHSRCELFVSSDGNTEKLTSGLVKPFLTHLKVAEEQVALAAQSIKLETERHKNAGTWFTKGTLERFVQFVSTPEVLEMVITFDAEMSQLEAARRIYSQGAGDQHLDSQGGNGTGAVAAADATTKELLKAIDVRLSAVRQDLTTSCARAAAAGFNPHTVSQLQHFAQQFLAHRLNEACTKYMSLYERRPDIISPWKQGSDDKELRSSICSDMSIDTDNGTHLRPNQREAQANASEPAKPSTWQHPKSFSTFQRCSSSSNNLNQKGEANDDNNQKEECPGPNDSSPSTPPSGPAMRRLSVQDRISLFENKQKENSSGSGSGPKPAVGKSIELRRLPANVSLSTEKPILRRWSGVSDMSIEVSGDKKDNNSPLCTPSSVSSVSQTKSSEEDKDPNNSNSEVNADQVVRTDQQSSQDTSNISIFNQERTSDSGGFKDQEERTFESHLRSSEVVGRKTSQLSFGVVTTSVVSDVKLSGMREYGGMKNHAITTPSLIRGSHGHYRSRSAQFEGVGVKLREGSVQGGSSQSTTTGPSLRSFTRELDDSSFSINQQKGEESEVPKMRYQKPQPGSHEQISKSHGKRDEIRGANENNKLDLPGKEVLESQYDARVTSTTPSEQVQRLRNFKGNQGLHDQLKLKAEELEKLFEEHKLRVPGDQPGSARRAEPEDAHMEETVNSQFRRPGVVESTPPFPSRNTAREMTTSSSNVAMSDAKSLVKTMDTHEYGNALRKSFSDLSFGDDSRGKCYEKYTKKRNAKLKEEWSSNRAAKEARMKAIQDSLEQSRAQMKAKFLGSIDRQDSVLGAHRADKLKYFKSNIEKDQHPIDLLENEDLSEFSEEKIYGTSRQSRKNLPNRHMPAATPHTTVTSISRSYGRRRDNPLAQSVPNFSDLRKENTKPSSGVSKTTRLQVRNHAHSKSTTEEMQCIQEEKTKRTQSLRKNSANPTEFKDLPPLNSDGVVLTPLRFHMHQIDLGPPDQSPRSLLKKANIIGPGSVGNTFRMKASMASDTQKTEEFEELEYEVVDSLHMTVEEQDVIETMAIEGYAYNNGKVRLSQEPEKSGNSGSEIGDSTRSLSQVDPTSVGEMTTAFSSTFNGVGSLQDSPAESPVSWNSHMHHPFSYPHESSDIDVSADSPIGSPPSWNSHSLTQVENDAARMRKKWGSAQKPFLVPNSSQNQPRKDVTRGFKRLLKFGRKSRGSESLGDWISATTSEGDDDTEDGRDPANRSSEDLRKSRMGFSHGHPSDVIFNESELFNEHVQSMQSSIPAPPAHFRFRDDHIPRSSLKGKASVS
ncbi:hypothetical protein TanjilG_13917 [Lupinus angustifolius]|uniref:COP1-interacting protein 7 n=1 Tax=Lupinus angustifolius TaxID=3871 RepID=A0A1J7GVE6_LUPAN|nr:hypothetical protein TanjilG_13917 [Lupinus angustifolius]